jgi:hypothetical protein
MLRSNPQDGAKIEAAVRSIIAEAIAADRGVVIILNSRFYEELKLSQLKKINFAEEVHDVLDGTRFAKEFGNWIYHELDRGDYLFVQVTKPGQSFGRMDMVLQGLAVMIDPRTVPDRIQSWKQFLPKDDEVGGGEVEGRGRSPAWKNPSEGGGIPAGELPPIITATTDASKSQA